MLKQTNGIVDVRFFTLSTHLSFSLCVCHFAFLGSAVMHETPIRKMLTNI